MTSESFKRLTNNIKDIEEYITDNKVNIVHLHKEKFKNGKVEISGKQPIPNAWHERRYNLDEPTYYTNGKNERKKLPPLREHYGNYGLLVGYKGNEEQKASLAVIDIDGYTDKDLDKEAKAELKQRSKVAIHEDFKDFFDSLHVQTQSVGYHLILWNETQESSSSKIAHSLKFPKNYRIKELRGKNLKDSFEIFTNYGSKQVVLPGSKTTAGEYKVIGEIDRLKDVDTVHDLNQEVLDYLIKKGYEYDPEAEKNSSSSKSNTKAPSNSQEQKLKELSDTEIEKVVSIIIPFLKAIDGSKHKGALYLGGYFSYHITSTSTEKIADGVNEKISSIFKNPQDFKRTLLESYKRDVDRAGLPTLLDLVGELDSSFNVDKLSEDLNSICNSNFRKEKLATVTIGKNEVPIYVFETERKKWLKYEGIIEGIDLTLNFKDSIGKFIYTETGELLDTFKFKFNNSYLEIVNFDELKKYWKDKGETLPKHFERELRLSLNSIDSNITQPNSKRPHEHIPEDPHLIRFGVKDNSYYVQNSKTGITLITITKDNKERTERIANVVIKDITIIKDSLKLMEPVYNCTYFNKTFNEEVTVEYLDRKKLVDEFITARVFYASERNKIETVLNTFIISGSNLGRITTREEAYLEGFFMVGDKVVSNTELIHTEEPTPETLGKAIQLLNDVMKNRSPEGKANDSAVYRFMLYSPFSYCLKQVGWGRSNYSIIPIGKSQVNKTGAIKIGNLFYAHTEEETTGSTVSVFGSKLGENSYPSIFDECSHLFGDAEALNVMKRAVYEKTGRAVKDRNDNSKIDNFKALNLPVFIMNERIAFKDFITNRYDILNYTAESVLTDQEVAEFQKTYVPESKDTILKELAVIGKYFSKKMIEVLETPEERKKLSDVRGLTIDILKQMQEEAGVEFLPEMLEPTITSDKYNYDIKAEVVKLLNNDFKTKNRNTGEYTSYQFVQSAKNKDFDFLTYNKNAKGKTADRHFIINSSKLEKYVNNGRGIEETVELTDILEYLGLDEILKARAELSKVPYEEYIKTQYNIKVGSTNKTKNITGFYLTVEEVANHLFGFDLDFSKNQDKTKTKVKIEKVENQN